MNLVIHLFILVPSAIWKLSMTHSGHSEVRYAILGNILHPQKFCPIISIEVSTKLSDIALTISTLVLEYS